MRRSSKRPSERRNGSRTTATAGSLETSARGVAVASPNSTLANGVVVEANVLARLLGMRLLRLEAHLVLTPAEVIPVNDPAPPASSYSGPVQDGTLADAIQLLSQASATLDTTRGKSS